jgi:hypothetical protein
MVKEFICRFKLPNGMYTMVIVSGPDLNAESARIKSIDYMEANGSLAKFVTAYEKE